MRGPNQSRTGGSWSEKVAKTRLRMVSTRSSRSPCFVMSKSAGMPPCPRTPRLNAMLCSLPSRLYTQLWYMHVKFSALPCCSRQSIEPRCTQRFTKTRMRSATGSRTTITGVSPIQLVRYWPGSATSRSRQTRFHVSPWNSSFCSASAICGSL